MKPSTEWTEEDIDNLITAGTNESSSLEYKQCSALRTQGIACRVQDQALVEMDHTQSKDKIVSEISKDVSSFANADGGTIIYGIVEDKHLPFCIDPHPFDPSELPKETLENIIDSINPANKYTKKS
jgi:hypothetical protein